ncbi:MAG: c-type cytochrome [Gammaproteobacteria bacterium]|nr:c-type cytochrome [Gammaproteobacteria bacterium]
MKKSIVMYAGLAVSLMAGPVLAADAAAGKAKAAPCASCHGAEGISTSPAYPSIAGMDAAAFSAAMQEYKSGARPNPLMQSFTKNLSDADIENLAAYYASLPGASE